MAEFIGFSGHCVYRDARPYFVILANSNGEYISDQDGLSFFDCLDFIQKTPKGFQTVCYGLDGLANFIFRGGLTLAKAKRLNSELVKVGRGNSFRFLEYIPKRFLQIDRWLDNKFDRKHTLWDLWAFFNEPIQSAIDTLGIEFEAHSFHDQREFCRTADFPEVLRYALAEAQVIKSIAENVAQALAVEDISPRSWCGHGSASSAILGKYKKLHPEIELQTKAEGPEILSAYYGGRVQTVRAGYFEEAYSYDINSAYPAAIATMPIVYGDFIPCDQLEEFGLVEIEWDNCPLSPAPLRMVNNHVLWASSGRSIVHSIEAAQALKYGARPLRFWKPEAVSESRPYAKMIEEIFQARYRSDLPHIMKGAANGLYGKFCQFRTPKLGEAKRKDAPPKWRSIWAAGYITAYTRAQMLDALFKAPQAVIAVHTDGFLSSEPHDVKLGPELGQWKEKVLPNLGLIEANLWKSGSAIYKRQGFNNLDFDFAFKQFMNWGPYSKGINSEEPYFMTWGNTSIAERDQWCRFRYKTKRLNLIPRYGHIEKDSEYQYRLIQPEYSGDSYPWNQESETGRTAELHASMV